MQELIKYEIKYIVIFKDETMESIELSEQGWKQLIMDLNSKDFVMIAWNFMNKYEVKQVRPVKEEDFIWRRLAKEPKIIQEQVNKWKTERKRQNKKITLWVIEQMIKKAKWDESYLN